MSKLPEYEPMSTKQLLISLIKDRKVVKTEAVTTSAGEQTTTYLDIPAVLGDERALHIATSVLNEHIAHLMGSSDEPNMVVGPMTGSIPLVMGLALESGHAFKWSIIRDEVKDHGLQRGFVGATPGPGDKVILVDDVVSSGGSMAEAYQQVIATGAEVLAVVPLVDRGGKIGDTFRKGVKLADPGVPYLPVLTYKDLEIEAL
jgi:orotate phosphoribosyltransferase